MRIQENGRIFTGAAEMSVAILLALSNESDLHNSYENWFTSGTATILSWFLLTKFTISDQFALGVEWLWYRSEITVKLFVLPLSTWNKNRPEN